MSVEMVQKKIWTSSMPLEPGECPVMSLGTQWGLEVFMFLTSLWHGPDSPSCSSILGDFELGRGCREDSIVPEWVWQKWMWQVDMDSNYVRVGVTSLQRIGPL